MTKEVILTGIRANNALHIGNYFGALLPIVDMVKRHADDFTINLFVPDLHSFTTPIDHGKLFEQTMKTLKMFVASGLPLDNNNVRIYRQSYIPAHSELTWILDCFTGFGELSRMTQFKDKSTKLGDNRISVGLFNYPVLMASDILLYGASYVPVGEDQTQHLEFTRDIAERINQHFGNLFVVPKPVKEQYKFFGKDQGLRIKDLIDPSKKMAKSDATGKGVIFLNDELKVALEKIKGATTDSIGRVDYEPERQPGVSNLLQILALLSGSSIVETLAIWKGSSNYGALKSEVAHKLENFLHEIQTNYSQVDEVKLINKLERDEQELNDIANKTLYRVQEAIGLRARA